MRSPFPIERRTFALLIDGLSRAKSKYSMPAVARWATSDVWRLGRRQYALFERTAVLIDGRFVSAAAALVLVSTPHPFEVFKSEHAAGYGKRWWSLRPTPTGASSRNQRRAGRRRIRPALGPGPENSPCRRLPHPWCCRVGGVPYVRSIQPGEPGPEPGFCAIDEGLVLSGVSRPRRGQQSGAHL